MITFLPFTKRPNYNYQYRLSLEYCFVTPETFDGFEFYFVFEFQLFLSWGWLQNFKLLVRFLISLVFYNLSSMFDLKSIT